MNVDNDCITTTTTTIIHLTGLSLWHIHLVVVLMSLECYH